MEKTGHVAGDVFPAAASATARFQNLMSDLFVTATAVMSKDLRYRYSLSRIWNNKLPLAMIVMLNPSTADDQIDDPTIMSCMRLTRTASFGGFVVGNLFAYRATDPDDLASVDDPVGPENNQQLERMARGCEVAICAWGAHKAADRRWSTVTAILRKYHAQLLCWDRVKSGAPMHPLYIAAATPLEPWA